jgi:YD repeat-containing protein
VVTSFAYDARGYLESETLDPGGLAIVRSYQYDVLGRRTREVDPRGFVTRTAYNDHGQPTEVEDAEGNVDSPVKTPACRGAFGIR